MHTHLLLNTQRDGEICVAIDIDAGIQVDFMYVYIYYLDIAMYKCTQINGYTDRLYIGINRY